MEVVFILIPISVLLTLIVCAAFVWSVQQDQFEDLDKESERILVEEGDRE